LKRVAGNLILWDYYFDQTPHGWWDGTNTSRCRKAPWLGTIQEEDHQANQQVFDGLERGT